LGCLGARRPGGQLGGRLSAGWLGVGVGDRWLGGRLSWLDARPAQRPPGWLDAGTAACLAGGWPSGLQINLQG